MKKNFFKKFSSTLITGSLILTSVMPQCSIFAANENNRATQLPQKGIDWDYDENNKTLTINTNKAMYGYNVETDQPFVYCENRPWNRYEEEIKVVVIGQNVTKIKRAAFCNCHNLLEVKFDGESKVKKIEWFAFFKCENLSKIIIPSSMEDIDYDAFYGCCSLKDITFQEGNDLKSISKFDFLVGYPTSQDVEGAEVPNDMHTNSLCIGETKQEHNRSFFKTIFKFVKNVFSK